MSFLDNYEPVEVRLARFWERFPEGRIITHVIEFDSAHCVIQSEAYRDAEDLRPAATGYAHEVATAKGINATSMLEVCETSSIGRCLANLGFAAKGSRPSREEMQKTARPTVDVNGLKARIAKLPAETRAQLKTNYGWPPSDPDALARAVSAAESAAVDTNGEEPF